MIFGIAPGIDVVLSKMMPLRLSARNPADIDGV